jgi:hypothetical protein
MITMLGMMVIALLSQELYRLLERYPTSRMPSGASQGAPAAVSSLKHSVRVALVTSENRGYVSHLPYLYDPNTYP